MITCPVPELYQGWTGWTRLNARRKRPTAKHGRSRPRSRRSVATSASATGDCTDSASDQQCGLATVT